MKKKNIVYCFIVFLLLFSFAIPNVVAKQKDDDDKANYEGGNKIKSATGESGTFSQPIRKKAEGYCEDAMGFDIDVSDYDYDAGFYGKSVAPRKITIKAKNNKYFDDAKYKYIVYIAPLNKLPKIDEDCTNNGKNEKCKNIDPDVIYEHGTVDAKGTDVKHQIGENQEALIVVYASKDITLTSYKKLKNTNGKRVYVKCRKLNITDNNPQAIYESTFADGGNYASLYVQNPKSSYFVENVNSLKRDDGGSRACQRAKKGEYHGTEITDKAEKDRVSVQPGEEAEWVRDYYGKVLEKFCECDDTQFNLRAKQISTLSNYLIRVFRKIKDLEKKQATASADMVCQEGSDCHNLTKGETIKLDCNYNIKDSNYKNTMSYLYIDSSQKGEANIYTNWDSDNDTGDHTTITVCKVTCYEKIKITYSPPEVTKAGLCFPYKVTISSNVDCAPQMDKTGAELIAKITEDFQKLSAPAPQCSNAHKSAQAGPNEQFDACVKSCDDGKYTQACINKCYKEVYGTKEESKKSTSSKEKKSVKKETTETASVVQLNNLETKDSYLKNMADKDDDDKVEFPCLITGNGRSSKYKYYKDTCVKVTGDQVPSGCTDEEVEKATTDAKKVSGVCKITCSNADLKNYVHSGNTTKLNECARFFTEAKAMEPYGKHVRHIISKTDNSKNYIEWHYSRSRFPNYTPPISDSYIPKQLAVASPFYLRDAESTADLIKDLVVPANKSGKWRKYSIDTTGIKRQYSSRYQCDEHCWFPYVSGILSPYEYQQPIRESLKSVLNALEQCEAATVCETGTTDYSINVQNTVITSTGYVTKEVTPEGKTELGKSNDGNKNEMFVVGNLTNDEDKSIVPPTVTNTNGILGICYKKEIDKYKYRTTVTFPQSYLNVKNGSVCWEKEINPSDDYMCGAKVDYDDQKSNKGSQPLYVERKNEFCSILGSADVNTEWFSYVKEGGAMPANRNNIKDNIKVKANRFGKYKWKIRFNCFYAMKKDVKITTPTTPTTPTPTTTEENNTAFTNYSFQVIEQDDLLKTEENNQKIGYNWTSKAQITSLKDENAAAKTYAINPEKYIDYVRNDKGSEKESVVYHIKLDKEALRTLRAKEETKDYTSFTGEYKKINGVDGMLRYRSDYIDGLGGNVLLSDSQRNDYIGINNKYTDIDSLLS